MSEEKRPAEQSDMEKSDMEQTLDDVHVHAVLIARAHRHYMTLDGFTASHVGAIIRLCRRAVPRLSAISDAAEAGVRALPPDETDLLELYRQKRAVDGGGAFERPWDGVTYEFKVEKPTPEAPGAYSRGWDLGHESR